MKSYMIALLLGILPLAGCSLTSGSLSPSANASPQAPAATKNSKQFRPETRIVPLTIEGSIAEVQLKLFDQKSLPFTTYMPAKEFVSEVGMSEEGTAARLYFSPDGVKDEKAYIHIFFPKRQSSMEELQTLLLGDRGLLATNGWELVDRTNIVSYAWAQEKLIYQQRTANDTYVGVIYVGDYREHPFYIFTHYPVEYSEGFEPRSTLVLENIQFRDEPNLGSGAQPKGAAN